jgi:hypothetical protein
MTRQHAEEAGSGGTFMNSTVPPDPASGTGGSRRGSLLELVEVGFLHDGGTGALVVAGANGRGGAA